MFGLFRKNQDTKKVVVTEKETDGFVLVGKTANEERNESKEKTSYCSTGPCYDQTLQKNSVRSTLSTTSTEVGKDKNQNMDSNPLSDLLSDVPFTLAPHVLAMQSTCNDFPGQLLSFDVNDNLTRFWYDFTLENSVLCES